MPLMPGVPFVGPIPSTNYAQDGGPKIGAVVHVIVGSAQSALGEFQSDGAELSAHFIVAGPSDGWPDGTILQVLDTSLDAYAQEDGNYQPTSYIAIEFAGDVTFPMSGAQMGAGAAILAWASVAHGFPLTGPVNHGTHGVAAHCNPDGSPDPAWGDHPCPGTIRLAQIPTMVALAQAIINPSQLSHRKEQDMITSVPHTDGTVDLYFYGPDWKINQLSRNAQGVWTHYAISDFSGWAPPAPGPDSP